MLNEIAFGAKDDEIVSKYSFTKNVPDGKDHSNEKFVMATIQVRLNGTKVLDSDQSAWVPKEVRLNYKQLKELFLTFFMKIEMASGEHLSTPVQWQYPEDKFWEEIHHIHLQEDGHKIPDDVDKYDIDVSLFINGALIYHGWQLIGMSGNILVKDIFEMASLTVKTGMSASTTEPTEEEINSFPW